MYCHNFATTETIRYPWFYSVVYMRVSVCVCVCACTFCERKKTLGKKVCLPFYISIPSGDVVVSPFHFEGTDGVTSIILAKLKHLPPRRRKYVLVLVVPVPLHNFPSMTLILHNTNTGTRAHLSTCISTVCLLKIITRTQTRPVKSCNSEDEHRGDGAFIPFRA